MIHDREEILREKQMAFIGKTLMSFPHNIRKRLAAISESAGSLSGLLGQADQWNDEDQQEFTKILSTIENQVNILSRKGIYLDRFAQRMDKTFITLDPGEIVEEVVSFSSRFARMRQASLELETAERVPGLYSNPLRIYFLVSIMIDDMLERLEKGGKVKVRVDRADNEVLIEVQGHGLPDTTAPSAEGIGRCQSEGRQAVDDLGGRLETSAIGPGIKKTSLFLPIKHAPEDL
jgi:phosphoglycerate-specific signal transduction histidine kinase